MAKKQPARLYSVNGKPSGRVTFVEVYYLRDSYIVDVTRGDGNRRYEVHPSSAPIVWLSLMSTCHGYHTTAHMTVFPKATIWNK